MAAADVFKMIKENEVKSWTCVSPTPRARNSTSPCL